MSETNPMTATHSPTPWELVEATEHHGPYICNVWGGDVCDLYTMSNPSMPSTASGGTSRPISFVDADANAALIVEAVNSHEALKARIQELESELASCRECRANLDCLSRGAVPVRDDGAERIRELEAALRPFAENAYRYAVGAPETPDQFQVYVSLGDCRAARTLLQPKDTAK